MKPRITIGLLLGIIGLVLAACTGYVFGLCGPLPALIVGALAGFLTGQREALNSKEEGARAGAVAGALAGVLALVGQVIGALIKLVVVQQGGGSVPFGVVPAPGTDTGIQLVYYLSGLGTGLCFGIIDIIVATLGGAGGGYFGFRPKMVTPQGWTPTPPPPPPPAY